MNAIELRIGNNVYAHLKSGNGRTVVHKIKATDLVKMDEGTGYLAFMPIPLTPELLQKCGFTKGNICYHNGYSISLLKTDFYLRPSYDDGFYWGFNLSEDKIDCELNDVRSIHYLHQLQNLFFALTGEELQINLNEYEI